MGPDGDDQSDREFLLLFAAIGRFRSRDKARRQPADLAADLIRLRRACDLLELDFSETAAAFSATNEDQNQGSTTPIDWIRHHCRMSGGAAADRVAVGEALPRLDESARAVEAGEIGFAHLLVMARTHRVFLDSGSADEFDETELLAQAREISVGRLWRVCQHLRHAVDQKAIIDAERRAAEARYLRLTTKDDGSLIVTGWFDAIGGAAVRTALEPLARKAGADDDRGREHRYADALIELSTFALETGQVPDQASNRPHLMVTTSLETLRGLKGAPAAELDRAAPISSEAVQRLACDATIRRVLLDSHSLVTDVGRARRVVSPATRAALNARDRTCQWPGCERPQSWSAAHHLLHWTQGGATDLGNLILLCHRHHQMVHEGGWQVVRTEDGVIRTIRPAPLPIAYVREPATAVA
ncbi:MAG TPA: DUF222 domain-containing protein [Candidatus Limnocylindrales bacterium]|nr:DUF222 domain-containing protein [Candidatus Limnocylindrales bacterium]